MENRITFFTFNDVRKSYQENLHQIRPTIIKKKRKLNEKKKELSNILNNNRKLNEDEKENLEAYNRDVNEISNSNFHMFRDFIESNKMFGTYRPTVISLPTIEEIQSQIEILVKEEKSRKKTYIKLGCEYKLRNHLSENNILKLKKSFFSKIYKSLKKKHDIPNIIEFKPHEPFYQKIKKLEGVIDEINKFISEFENKERIDTKDIDSLNHEILKMNQNGWIAKQIEGIQSGKAGSVFEGGYGYSFTEGVLILWERDTKI